MAVKFSNLNLIDRMTLAYHAGVLVLIVLFSFRIPDWHLKALPNIIVLAFLFLVIAQIPLRASGIPRLVKSFYPLVLFLPAYLQTGRINRIFFNNFLDPFFQKAEYAVFGFQPAIAFANAFPQGWFSECMHFAYFTYYLFMPSLALILYFRKDEKGFADYLFSLCFTFYICYLIYILLPVEGARAFGLNQFPQGGPFTAIMVVIYANCEVGGAAFPSSHVAVACLVLYYSIKYAWKTAWIYAILTVSIALATVYCRYHYAIDVFAGIVTAIALVAIARKNQSDFAGKQPRALRKWKFTTESTEVKINH